MGTGGYTHVAKTRSTLLAALVLALYLILGGAEPAVSLSGDGLEEWLDGLNGNQPVLLDFYACVPPSATGVSYSLGLKSPSFAHSLVESRPWCPHCKMFNPEFQEAAESVKRVDGDSAHVILAQVDCTRKGEVCTRIGVRAFPTLGFAKAGEVSQLLKTSSQGSKKGHPELLRAKNAKEVLELLDDRLNTHYSREGQAGEGQKGRSQPPSNRQHSLDDQGSDDRNGEPDRADLRDIEQAARDANADILSRGLLSEEHKLPYERFIRFTANAHPSKACRRGAQRLQKQLPSIWPEGSSSPDHVELHKYPICGEGRAPGYHQCRGSVAHSRGYPCGLWLMFHSWTLLPRDDAEAKESVVAVRDFVISFFSCTDCKEHFRQVALTEPAQSRREAALWLWRTHNIANARLNDNANADGSRDPSHPKVQFPPPGLCSRCWGKEAKGFDDREVYAFLQRFFAGESDEERARRKRRNLRRRYVILLSLAFVVWLAWPHASRLLGLGSGEGAGGGFGHWSQKMC